MASPIRMVGGPAASGSFRLELSAKDIARGKALLDRYRGAPLMTRMQKATLAAAKTMEAPMKAAAPKVTGHLRAKTRAQQIRQRTGWRTYAATSSADVGPRSPHRHLVIRGHRIVTPGGRDTGRRTSPNPYVDLVARRHYANAVRIMRQAIFDSEYGRIL
mgnify:CR=1 FL=1